MQPRRTQYEIYWEILTFCRAPKTFTSIINRCNLNSKIGQEHLQFLLEKGFLAATVEEDKSVYLTTDQSKNYLELFSTMYQTLFEKSPGFKL